jgi:pimeloyl-ACP methyl ester carboxylesterase
LALATLVGCRTTPHEHASIEQGVVAATDGVPIAYDVRGAGESAVVLVHGLGCDRALWRWTAEELAPDHRVVCMDLAGHGDSGAKERKTWDIATLGADVQTLVESLGLEHVVLVGHSISGPVCLDAARRMKGRVVAVVGVDTLHNAEAHIPPQQAQSMAASFEADREKAFRTMLPQMLGPGADPATVDWIIAQARKSNDVATAALFRSLLAADVGALLRGAGVRVRCVNAKPGAAPSTMPTDVATNRKYADFDAVLIDGVGHYPMIERPLTFSARLREVLASLR